jgi:uncharacterized Ntn-hydrolase superfamily protein
MTLSIAARCERTGELGVAAVTALPGVGKLLSWAHAGVGAIATQGWVNPYLGIDGLAMLNTGHTAAGALQAVTQLDGDRELRQVGIVDASGRAAAWTGGQCETYAGDVQGEGWTVQGNLLDAIGGLEACGEAFVADPDDDLVHRLIAALKAGEEAGGDRRGARSATVLVVATEHYPLWDIRVDDHDEPLEELVRMQELFAERVLPHVLALPTREKLSGGLSSDRPTGLV